MVRRLQTVRSCRIADIPVDASRAEIYAGCKNDRAALIDRAGIRFHADDPLFHRIADLLLPVFSVFLFKGPVFSRDLLRQDLSHLGLADRQVIRVFKGAAHGSRILLLIRLGAQGMDRRPL